LSESLAGAVKEKRLSQQRMQSIIAEHDKLRDEDKSKARDYVEQVVGAIEAGGDSTHIEAARKMALRRQGEKKV
jgi:hypothetical protein